MNRRLIARLILIAATIVVYWQVTSHDYVDFDDPEYARDNVIVQHGLTVEGIQWAFTTGYDANWHPLTWLSLMADAQLYSMLGMKSAGGFHLTNLLLHVLNVLLLLELLLAMTGAFWRSAMVAALLALHPLHVESVAWIAERKDVLSMFLWLLTMRAYLIYAREGGVRPYVMTAILLALGLMAKPMLVTLPMVLLLLDYWPLGRGFWILDFGFWIRRNPPLSEGSNPKSKIQNPKSDLLSLILEKLPLLAIAAASAWVTAVVQHGSGQLEDGEWMPLRVRLANAIASYVRYIGKMLWPLDLAVLYPNPAIIGRPMWAWWHVVGAAAILLVITAFAVARSRKQPYFIVGWLWYLGTMVPVIGLMQIGRHSLADRYTYIPFIGLYIIVAWGIADLTTRWKSRTVPLAVMATLGLTACAALTYRQVSYWRDSVTLFQHALAVTRDNWLIRNDLAAVLARQKEYDKAIALLKTAIEIYPQCGWMHEHLGELYSSADNLYDAQIAFDDAVKLDPKNAKSHFNLGVTLVNRGRPGEAIDHLRKAVALKSDDVEARKALAIALASQGFTAEAIDQIEQAKKLRPDRANEFDQVLRAISRPR